jgi:succinoglycan biosynthesis transport protein ExoP
MSLTELRNQEIQTQSGSSASDLELLLQQGGVDVWGILARRKWLVILGLILGLGLGYIYLLQADPVYESLAQVLIEERKPPSITLTGMDTQFGLSSEEAKHAHMLQSPRILTLAYEDFKLERLPTFVQAGDQALLFLSENLTVDLVEEGTNILTVGFRGPNPDDTQTVVNGLLATYQKFLQKTYKNTGDQTRDMFVQAKDELLGTFKSLREEYSEFKRNTPLLWQAGEAINLHQDRQVDYERERVTLQKDLADIESKIRTTQAAITTGEDLEAVLLLAERDGSKMLQEQINYRQELQRVEYIKLLLQEEDLSRRYGPDHPDVLTLRAQLHRYQEMFPDIVDTGQDGHRLSGNVNGFVASYLGSLKQRHQQLRSRIGSLDQLFSDEEQASKLLQQAQAEDERLRGELERTQQMFDITVKSLEELSLVTDYEGYKYEKLADPLIGEKVAPMALKVIPISGMLGVLAGFGIAYLVDITDKAFRTPDEVSQVMRLPVVGHIPLIDTSDTQLLPGSKVSAVVVTVHRPKSPQSESYRAVRTSLYFNAREQRNQVIQVSSPMPGDGKSTLIANLAVTIAQSGKRVLLMDADFRRPTLHRVFGIEAGDVGLASVVRGTSEPSDAIAQVPEVPNLSILPCGPRPDNPSELLSSEQFEQVLDIYRRQFDFVLIDTPPVLAVSDPCAVAARVDGVLLTFRIHKRARPLAVRAREALSSTGANVIGVVVNGVDQEAGGYYSQYRYGFSGYRYAGGYRYGVYGAEAAENKALGDYVKSAET